MVLIIVAVYEIVMFPCIDYSIYLAYFVYNAMNKMHFIIKKHVLKKIICKYKICWLEPDWLASKICQIKDLASHDFGYYLVAYQNLPSSHIWLTKSMAIFFT